MGTNNGNGYKGRFTAEEVANAITKAKGFTSYAARSLGCSARTVSRYIKKHPTVALAREEARELFKDDAESKLAEHIRNDNVTALIFYLKTQAKDRGYVERQEFAPAEGATFEFNVTLLKSD